MYKRYIVMKEMKWNYWEYESTPSFIINQIVSFMNTEIKAREEQNG